MSENKLKLNPGKTEFIVFGAKDRYKWLSDSFPVNILVIVSLPQMLYAIWLFGLMQSSVSPIRQILSSNLVLLASGTFIVSGGFSPLIHQW